MLRVGTGQWGVAGYLGHLIVRYGAATFFDLNVNCQLYVVYNSNLNTTGGGFVLGRCISIFTIDKFVMLASC